MATNIDSSYMVASLFAPTLHVLLTPIWIVLSGHAEQAIFAMMWQLIAWLYLWVICLATMCPLLWLVRDHAIRFSVDRAVAWSIATLLAAVASYSLFHCPALSWGAAFASALVIFVRLQDPGNRIETVAPAPDAWPGNPAHPQSR